MRHVYYDDVSKAIEGKDNSRQSYYVRGCAREEERESHPLRCSPLPQDDIHHYPGGVHSTVIAVCSDAPEPIWHWQTVTSFSSKTFTRRATTQERVLKHLPIKHDGEDKFLTQKTMYTTTLVSRVLTCAAHTRWPAAVKQCGARLQVRPARWPYARRPLPSLNGVLLPSSISAASYSQDALYLLPQQEWKKSKEQLQNFP